MWVEIRSKEEGRRSTGVPAESDKAGEPELCMLGSINTGKDVEPLGCCLRPSNKDQLL